MGSEIDHLKLAVLRFFCWINQAFASKQALSMLNRTLCQSGLAELGPVPPSLCGAEFALLVIDLIIARSLSLDAGRARRAAKLSENEAPAPLRLSSPLWWCGSAAWQHLSGLPTL